MEQEHQPGPPLCDFDGSRVDSQQTYVGPARSKLSRNGPREAAVDRAVHNDSNCTMDNRRFAVLNCNVASGYDDPKDSTSDKGTNDYQKCTSSREYSLHQECTDTAYSEGRSCVVNRGFIANRNCAQDRSYDVDSVFGSSVVDSDEDIGYDYEGKLVNEHFDQGRALHTDVNQLTNGSSSFYDWSLIWCAGCGCGYHAACSKHKPVVIADKAVAPLAWASLPAGLKILKVDVTETGVFARRPFPSNCVFGPFVAEMVVNLSDISRSAEFPLMIVGPKEGSRSYLNPSNESTCNWMMFVRRAKVGIEQNLVAYQQGHGIYFATTRSIPLGEELRVWYAPHYIHLLVGKRLLDVGTDETPVCVDCDEGFLTPAALRRHRIGFNCKALTAANPRRARKGIPYRAASTSNSEEAKLECPSCELHCNTASELNHHLLRCQLSEGFANKMDTLGDTVIASHDLLECEALQPHEQQTVKTETVNNECPLPEGSTHRAVNEDARAERRLFRCQKCAKRFLTATALHFHTRSHSKRAARECFACLSVFSSKKQLLTHAQQHLVQGKFVCPKCPEKSYSTFMQIKKHMAAIHSSRRFACDICQKTFPRPDKLRLHMITHTRIREFMCDTCGKQFGRKDKLQEHIRRMHAPDREAGTHIGKPATKRFTPKVLPSEYQRFIYKCQDCALGFKRRGMLINHLSKRHPNVSISSIPELNLPILRTQKDYYCLHCSRVYKSSSKRKLHILKSHPGCELPPSAKSRGEGDYSEDSPFTATVGSVTTFPVQCDFCHKQYASRAKLIQHQRRKHPNQAPSLKRTAHKARSRTHEPLILSLQPLHLQGDENRTDGATDLLTQAMTVNELNQTLTEFNSQPQSHAVEYRLVNHLTLDLSMHGASLSLAPRVHQSTSSAGTNPNIDGSPHTSWSTSFFKLQ